MGSLGTRFYSGLKISLTVFCLLCFLMEPGQAAHEFNLGKNVTLFHSEFKSSSPSYKFIVSISGSSQPFFVHDKIVPSGLKPGQAERVHGKVEQSNGIVTIVISIHNVQPIDEGLYIVELQEGTGPGKTYYKNFTVRYPPGRADCQKENPPNPSGDWLAFCCNATVGSDNTGFLKCYQNSKQVPYLEPVRFIDNFMIGVFWMDPTKELKCCSTYNASDVDMDSCNDFVQPSSDDLITKARSSVPTAGPFVTEDEIHVDQCDGGCGVHRVATGILGTLVSLYLVLQLGAAGFMYRKKKRENNNTESISLGGRQNGDEEQPLGA